MHLVIGGLAALQPRSNTASYASYNASQVRFRETMARSRNSEALSSVALAASRNKFSASFKLFLTLSISLSLSLETFSGIFVLIDSS